MAAEGRLAMTATAAVDASSDRDRILDAGEGLLQVGNYVGAILKPDR
jgi:hypothetical protein